jgi:hypothetical protein
LSPFTNQNGKIYMSEDAIGTNDPAGGPIRVHKNNSSTTVAQAWLFAAAIPQYTLVDGDVTLNGTSLTWDPAFNAVNSVFGETINTRGVDVTSIVKPVVDSAPAGDVTFTAAEPNQTGNIDGEVLAVILNDPTLPTNNTVSFLFGALAPTGDNFSIGLAQPLNLSDPNLALTMSLGDSFGYQGPPATGQFSQIDVNGNRMTTSAGGNDDSVCKNDSPQDFQNCVNGTLITVGGIGDSTANPPDPNATDSTCGPPGPPRCDDELYDLKPFVKNGDTSIKVATLNPSDDDNIFFTGFQLNSAAAVVGEGILLSPTTATNPVGGTHTVTATVRDTNGDPIPNIVVTFKVTAGPNAGQTGTGTTDSGGHATFTYTDTGGAGTDSIVATFKDVTGAMFTSNTAFKTWGSSGGGAGDIFEVTFENCNTLHIGYNRFPNGTIIHWRVNQSGTPTLASGSFPAIGGGKLGSKTYHFINIPLGFTLKPEPIQSHARFWWEINGVITNYAVTRDPGC